MREYGPRRFRRRGPCASARRHASHCPPSRQAFRPRHHLPPRPSTTSPIWPSGSRQRCAALPSRTPWPSQGWKHHPNPGRERRHRPRYPRCHLVLSRRRRLRSSAKLRSRPRAPPRQASCATKPKPASPMGWDPRLRPMTASNRKWPVCLDARPSLDVAPVDCSRQTLNPAPSRFGPGGERTPRRRSAPRPAGFDKRRPSGSRGTGKRYSRRSGDARW